MIDVNDLRKGVTFELDGELYRVLDYQHHKPGRGNAIIRTKIRNLRSGGTLEKTFTSGDRVQDVRLESRQVQYLYHDGDLYHFMDTETYEQPILNASLLGDAVNYLTDGLILIMLNYQNEPIEIELPITVEMQVIETEAGVRGDTATGATKLATVESGLKVQVPLFVETGDRIRIDTRNGSYITRV
jgi:elongation factor P